MRGLLLLAQIAVIGLISIAGIVYVGYSAASRFSASPSAVAYTTALIKVDPGETTADIGRKLSKEGLIRSELVFRLLVARRNLDGQLQAGEYLLRQNMPLNEIIDSLLRGRIQNNVITIVEGWRAEQIAEALGAQGLMDPTEFMTVVRDGLVEFSYSFLPPPGEGRTLEGFLFPDTYEIGPTTSARDLVGAMLKRFDEVYTRPMRDAAASRGLNALQVVTLASIVEREAAVDEERPRIAAVLFNRLAQGMKLEMDPTVQYAVAQSGSSDGWWKAQLTLDDLQVQSPYNTYVVPALPAGPIASPGVRSVLAVIEPDQTDELFFVARGDGTHAFATTREEHELNVERFQR